MKSHNKENMYNFYKKNHKLESHCYFLANFQYQTNLWIATNNKKADANKEEVEE